MGAENFLSPSGWTPPYLGSWNNGPVPPCLLPSSMKMGSDTCHRHTVGRIDKGSYSRGSTNKNGNYLVAEKILGKHADKLRQACGQFSSQSHEPFLRKCLYKESEPEILATTPKKIVKITKKCGIASFHSGERVVCVSKKVISWFPHKKIF